MLKYIVKIKLRPRLSENEALSRNSTAQLAENFSKYTWQLAMAR